MSYIYLKTCVAQVWRILIKSLYKFTGLYIRMSVYVINWACSFIRPLPPRMNVISYAIKWVLYIGYGTSLFLNVDYLSLSCNDTSSSPKLHSLLGYDTSSPRLHNPISCFLNLSFSLGVHSYIVFTFSLLYLHNCLTIMDGVYMISCWCVYS